MSLALLILGGISYQLMNRPSQKVAVTDGLGNLVSGYDPTLATQRNKLVQNLCRQGVIVKIQLAGRGGVTDVVATSTFERLSYKRKEILAGVFFAWGLDHTKRTFAVRFRSTTNQNLGTYDLNNGLFWGPYQDK